MIEGAGNHQVNFRGHPDRRDIGCARYQRCLAVVGNRREDMRTVTIGVGTVILIIVAIRLGTRRKIAVDKAASIVLGKERILVAIFPGAGTLELHKARVDHRDGDTAPPQRVALGRIRDRHTPINTGGLAGRNFGLVELIHPGCRGRVEIVACGIGLGLILRIVLVLVLVLLALFGNLHLCINIQDNIRVGLKLRQGSGIQRSRNTVNDRQMSRNLPTRLLNRCGRSRGIGGLDNIRGLSRTGRCIPTGGQYSHTTDDQRTKE